jgi:hypothetical protein
LLPEENIPRAPEGLRGVCEEGIMARPNPVAFDEKYRRVQKAVEAALGAERRHFDFTGEVELGVRLLLSEAGGRPLALSLWTLPQDISELCGDAAMPATAGLLAIDGEQARAATAAGLTVDLAQLTRSQSHPDVYYALFDYASRRRIHEALRRLVPALEQHPVAA